MILPNTTKADRAPEHVDASKLLAVSDDGKTERSRRSRKYEMMTDELRSRGMHQSAHQFSVPKLAARENLVTATSLAVRYVASGCNKLVLWWRFLSRAATAAAIDARNPSHNCRINSRKKKDAKTLKDRTMSASKCGLEAKVCYRADATVSR